MTKLSHKILPASFYRTAAGTEPVRDWLRRLGAEDRLVIGTDIRTVEFGWPIGMPVCRPMGDGLFEVRSSLTQNRNARVLFLHPIGQDDPAARLREKDPEDSGSRSRHCIETQAGS